MSLQIIEVKEKHCFLRQSKTEVDGIDASDEKKKRFRITVGTYLEFNDGWVIQGPDGRIHNGKGTVVRFNYRHQSWSVQRPQRCETDVLGYVFTSAHEPGWLKPERELGFTTNQFKRSFSPSFVKLCIDAHNRLSAKPLVTLRAAA